MADVYLHQPIVAQQNLSTIGMFYTIFLAHFHALLGKNHKIMMYFFYFMVFIALHDTPHHFFTKAELLRNLFPIGNSLPYVNISPGLMLAGVVASKAGMMLPDNYFAGEEP